MERKQCLLSQHFIQNSCKLASYVSRRKNDQESNKPNTTKRRGTKLLKCHGNVNAGIWYVKPHTRENCGQQKFHKYATCLHTRRKFASLNTKLFLANIDFQLCVEFMEMMKYLAFSEQQNHKPT